MLQPTTAWKEFNRADERARLRDLTYAEALARYEAHGVGRRKIKVKRVLG